MRESCVRGIVINRAEYGERDVMLTLYSLEGGRLSVVVRGTRKQGSTLRRGADFFREGDFYLVSRRGLPLLTQWEPVSAFSALPGSADKLSLGFYMLRAANEVTAPGDADPAFYNLLRNSLLLVENCLCYDIIKLFFDSGILVCNGLPIDWNACRGCEGPVGEESVFDVEEGGVVCAACARRTPGNRRMKVCLETLRTGKNIYRALDRLGFGPLDGGRRLETALREFERFSGTLKSIEGKEVLTKIVRRFFQYHVNEGVVHWYIPL